MSQVELYQSVLLKLGQLPASELVILNNYLTHLTRHKNIHHKPAGVAHLGGAWKSWDDHDFEEFLQFTQKIRNDLFAPRSFSV
jgi:hypothetical protein